MYFLIFAPSIIFAKGKIALKTTAEKPSEEQSKRFPRNGRSDS